MRRRGGTAISDSLSKFLVTLLLGELVFGSVHMCSGDEFEERFRRARKKQPVWIGGPSVYGDFNIHLWRDTVLVLDSSQGSFFGTNNPAGMAVLPSGAPYWAEVVLDDRWKFGFRDDGSAYCRMFQRNRWRDVATARAATIDFEGEVAALESASRFAGRARDDHLPMIRLHRYGDYSTMGRVPNDDAVVIDLLHRVLAELRRIPAATRRRLEPTGHTAGNDPLTTRTEMSDLAAAGGCELVRQTPGPK